MKRKTKKKKKVEQKKKEKTEERQKVTINIKLFREPDRIRKLSKWSSVLGH